MSVPAAAQAEQLSPKRRRLRLPKPPRWIDSAFMALGLALVAWVISRYPLAAIAAACRQLGPSVALVLLLPLGWHASGATAVYLLLDRRIVWRKIFWARLAAESYNSLFFSVGGEPFRIRFLSRFVPTDQVVAALIRDRVLDMTSGYFVSAIFLFLGLRHYALSTALEAALGLYAGVTFALGLAGTAVVVTRLPGRAGALISRACGGSATVTATLSPRTIATVLPFYVGSRALGVLEIGVLLRLLGGRLDLVQAGFFDAVLNAAGAIGFLLPAALGVFEGTSVYLFGVLGLGGAQGVVFGLVRRARMILISAAGVALHWLGRSAMARAQTTAATAAAALAPLPTVATAGTSPAASTTAAGWQRALRRHAYTLFRAPLGIGRPQSAAAWDTEYSDGKWRKLDSAAQLGHYAILAAYVGHLFPAGPSILDVGCGHGRLFHLLRRSPLRRYVGLDLSAAAIGEAQQSASSDARFEVADFTSWTIDERYDAIIFNESIYYAPDPLQQLARYAAELTAAGVIVLSMVQSSMNAGIARRIRRQYETLHASVVRNESGETWEVSVIRPRR